MDCQICDIFSRKSNKIEYIDLEAGTLRLDPGMTKNRQGRMVYLTPEVKALLGGQLDRVKALERKLKRVTPCCSPTPPGRRSATQPPGCR